jgi:hypothetical protein
MSWPGTPPGVAPIRPARVTPILGLPIPGDADAADFVTDIGKLADRLDVEINRYIQDQLGTIRQDVDEAIRRSGVPVIAPSQLDTAPYNQPFEGMTVDLMVGDGVAWRMRYIVGHAPLGWTFVGGEALAAYDAGYNQVALGQWVLMAPAIAIPRTGVYRVEYAATGVTAAGIDNNVIYGTITYSPGAPIFSGEAGGQMTMKPHSRGSLTGFGSTITLGAGTVLYWATHANYHNASDRRGFRLRPVRIA